MVNKHQATFVVDVKGENTEEQFTGKFTCKTLLSHRDHLIKDQKRRELLGTLDAPAETRSISTSEIFSQLAVRLLEVPGWWTASNDGMELLDDEPLAAVYNKVMALDEVQIRRLKKEAEAAAVELKKESDQDKAEAAKE